MKLSDFKKPTAVFFQPAVHLPAMAEMGVTIAFGPCVENDKFLSPADLLAKEVAWMSLAASLGMGVVIKRPWKYALLPANVVGFLHSEDEPNAKGKPAALLVDEFQRMRAESPTMPIFLSLAGRNVTSANWLKNPDGTWQKPGEVKAIQDYAALCDIVTIDMYSFNANANRYKATWTADGVSKLKGLLPKLPVWTWLEANDQQLSPPPTPDVNRAPMPAEIRATYDAAEAAGQDGCGFFLTCDSGKYGWPGSWYPEVDRNGVSMLPQYAACRAIGLARRAAGVPPTPPAPPAPAPPPGVIPPPPAFPPPVSVPTIEQRLADLEAWRVAMGKVTAR